MENKLCPTKEDVLQDAVKSIFYQTLEMMRDAEPNSPEMQFGIDMIRVYNEYEPQP
jgi:hypothetical protein